jgi:hypothetical protein
MLGMRLQIDNDLYTRLEALSLVAHKPANQLIADLIRAEAARVLGSTGEPAPGAAVQRLREALGLPELPDNPAAERALDEALAKANAEADLLYGNQAAAA